MYQINAQESRPGYCVLSQPQGVNKLIQSGIYGCLTISLILFAIPFLAVFAWWIYMFFLEADYLGLLMPIGLILSLISVRWLTVWPKVPAKLVFDASERQVYILDTLSDTPSTSPSMSFGEINRILVKEVIVQGDKRQYRRYKVVLLKSDTSSWDLLGSFSNRDEAVMAKRQLLELIQWSDEQGTAMGEVNPDRDSHQEVDEPSSDFGTWSLPKSTVSSDSFDFESLSECSKITWKTKHPPGRKKALYACAAGLALLGLGLMSFFWLVKLLALIPLGIAYFIYQSLKAWTNQQEIRIYADHIELSTKTLGQTLELPLKELKTLAFDLHSSNMALRFVKHSEFDYVTQIKNKGDNATLAEQVEATRMLLKSAHVYVAYLDAGDILRLEELIQSEVFKRSAIALA